MLYRGVDDLIVGLDFGSLMIPACRRLSSRWVKLRPIFWSTADWSSPLFGRAGMLLHHQIIRVL
jgi:hypothetical protein